MQRILLSVALIAVVGLATLVSVLLQDPLISTFEIDRDRAALTNEITAIQAESNKYSGGLLKALIDIRFAISRNSLAMLDQKRTSLIRRISLDYRLDGKSVKAASDEELNSIVEELTQAEKKSSASKLEAAKYAGGLLQSMALIKIETDELSVSQLRLKFYSAKYGIPMLIPANTGDSKTTEQPPGKVVKDREAL